MKAISQEEMKKLFELNYLHHSNKGIVNQNNYTVGFYRTRNKRYIEDKYADIAKNIM